MQVSTPPPQQLNIPPAISRQISARGLGTPQQVVKPRLSMVLILGAIVCYVMVAFLLLPALLSMGAAPNPSTPPAFVAFAISALFGIVGTILLVAYVQSKWCLYFCIAGFLYQRGKKIDVYRWEEMEA